MDHRASEDEQNEGVRGADRDVDDGAQVGGVSATAVEKRLAHHVEVVTRKGLKRRFLSRVLRESKTL
jgi:hypothetical protein